MTMRIKPSLLLLSTFTLACSAGDEVGSPWQDADTSDGAFAPDIDLPPEGEGVPPTHLPPGECVYEPIENVFGFVHQCEGEAELSFSVTDLDDNEHVGTTLISFGPGATDPDLWVDADSYERPRVAACCGPFDYPQPTTQDKYPYATYCLADTVQQLCFALPAFIDRQAEAEPNFIRRAALRDLADTIEDKRGECTSALWGPGSPAPGAQDPINIHGGTSWSPTNRVTITLEGATLTDWTQASDWPEGEEEWRECQGIEDNDDFILPTAPFQSTGVLPVLEYPLLPGTTMTGTGPASSLTTIVPTTVGSQLALGSETATADLVVTGLYLRGQVASASINGAPYILDNSSIYLAGSVTPAAISGLYTIPTGGARFATVAVVEGDSRLVYMTNDDPIVFRYDTSTTSWEFDPFDLTFAESGFGTWRLSFDGLSFDNPI